MTPEEFQRFKEAEKAHLRKLKELKKEVRTLERQTSLRTAVENVAAGKDLLEKQKDLVDELALETARHEARLDVALDSSAETENRPDMEALEEDLQRERAQALVKQLKRQLGGEDEDRESTIASRPARHVESESTSAAEESEGRSSPGNPTKGPDDRPEKTIGRM